MRLLDTADWQGRIFVGAWKPGRGGTASSAEPATGETLAMIGLADPEDVTDAAVRAAAAQREWAARGAFERAAVLRRAAQLFQEHAQEYVEWIVRESGGVRGKGAHEVSLAVAECLAAAETATSSYGDLLRSALPRLSLERRIPVGVVAVISPFNVPLVLSIRSIAPALALGNAVLLKPDQRTTVCGGVLLARILAEAGVPAGVFQLLPGGVEVGAALVREPRVRVVAFTGSTRAGQLIAAEAAQTFTRTHLELGGNSPLVVLADADVEQAVALGAFGSFSNSGQVCMAVGRHLVHEALYGEYVARLAATAEALTVGDGWREDVALGPLIDDRQAARVADLVARSVAAGACVVAGGTREGRFFRPTVLADCTPQMPAYTEEVFGPVACVRRFATVDEAISMARDSDAGLSLGIVTNDMAAAMRIADEVPSGAVHVNDNTINDEPNAPFGGLGASGYSRVGGVRANTESFTETQWMTLRTVPAPRPLLGRHDLGDPGIRQYKSIP